MKSNIKMIGFDGDGKAFTVYYYSGATRSYVRRLLPDSAVKFIQAREGMTDKFFKRVFPRFGTGKNNYTIVGEIVEYVIVD